MMFKQNLYVDLQSSDAAERFDDLLCRDGVRVERIVSHGHASESGFWYDQDWDEWVLVLRGHATLEFESHALELTPGDHVLIPAGVRHRVQSTAPGEPTVWLAIHWDQQRQAS